MSSDRDYCITLKQEIYIPESNRWEAGRGDVIFCRNYEMDPEEVKIFDADNGHQFMIVSRDLIASIVHDEEEDE